MKRSLISHEIFFLVKSTMLLGFAVLFLNSSAQTVSFSFDRAAKHSLVRNSPAPDFFEGALTGNGGMGVVVCTRPDAVVLRFGHNDVWDIRVAEDNKEKLGTFREVFDKVSRIDTGLKKLEDDSWYAEYKKTARANYAKPYPRPFPCGSIVLGFDRRKTELLGHSLDISDGLVSIQLLVQKKDTVYLKVFTDFMQDRVWMKLVNKKGQAIPSLFNRIHVIPDVKTPKDFPDYTVQQLKNGVSFRQVLPSQVPEKYDREKGHPDDRAFRLAVVSSSAFLSGKRLNRDMEMVDLAPMEFALQPANTFWLCAELENGSAKKVSGAAPALELLQGNDFDNSYGKTRQSWKAFWSRSGVQLQDAALESIWYRNLYFLRCAAKAGVSCPGLFANWSFNDIGTAWHGDWHMNYNTQQPFWATLTSNHPELNLPYVEMVEYVSDVARKWAAEYYGMRGSFYPHSAYPVKMTMNPYPVPDWGWEIFETPWAVQGVWWHYLYSGDKDFLSGRAFPLIRDATHFIIDYMSREEAHGKKWGDDKYHIFPTVPPELYRLRPGFAFNSDGLADLTLIRFLFNAYLKSVDMLALSAEKNTADSVRNILAHFPAYPTAVSKEYGEVFVSVKGESPETVYNVPASLLSVFPGEDHGLHTTGATRNILLNTLRNSQNEGGNDLVFQYLQQARLGLLDLAAFKRAVQYSTLDNGTSSDFVLQVNGRYDDNTDFEYMRKMGIWFENFGQPAVINECLLQSYNGLIRVFPNWPVQQDASFSQLRAAGGLLVSSTVHDGLVTDIRIFGENAVEAEVYNPWGKNKPVMIFYENGRKQQLTGEHLRISIPKNQTIVIRPW
jgi:alpha-L-fucosidase 2